MKKLLILILFVSQITWGQMPPAVQQDLMNFEPGELIVKLKDNVDAGVTYSESGKALSSFNIGELLGIEEKIESSSVMFHQKSIEASIVNKEKMKAVYAAKAAANPNNGYVPKEPMTMKNIFVLKTLNQQENILMLIEEIKNNPNVEYAEPNYIYSIDDFEVGDIVYDETTDSDSEQESSETSDATIDVDDPLYSSQANITSTNIDDVWDQYTTGDGSQVIAILDTGGDYTHPDLEANTWINTEELNGVEGYDDDGNGYTDDIRGWDFINQDNAPLDDNMHGTHVAGIAGAVGNNGIGIAGAAWDVKLMHVKVFQASGQGNATNIAAGVEYASTNGATITNMSFGSYAESNTLKTALEYAYNTTILVAAAGNNSVCIGPGSGCAPFFPAAYTYVLGVEDRPKPTAGYTNFDQDGPIATNWIIQQLNYELAAPGTGIISTIPNGGYGTLTGTSMATPLVAGGLALYAQEKPEDSKELIFGTLVKSSGATYVDFLAALQIEVVPDLHVLTAFVSDTTSTNLYIDGQVDKGEFIEMVPLVKNYFGPSENVMVELKFGGNEFQNEYYSSFITLEDTIQNIGSVSAYGLLQNNPLPFSFHVSDDIPHDTQIEFAIETWDESTPEIKNSTSTFIDIKNAVKLQGIVETDTTLYANQTYILTNSFILRGDMTLTLKPGVTITFDKDNLTSSIGKISVYSNDTGSPKMHAIGTKDSLITFRKNPNIATEREYHKFFFGSGDILNWNFGGTQGFIDTYGDVSMDEFYEIIMQEGLLYNAVCEYCVFDMISPTNMLVNKSIILNNYDYNMQLNSGGLILKSNLMNFTNWFNSLSFDNVSATEDLDFESTISYGENWNGGIYKSRYNNFWEWTSYSNDAGGVNFNWNINGKNNIVNSYRVGTNWIGDYNSQVLMGLEASGFTEFVNPYVGAQSIAKLEELNYDEFDGGSGVWLYTNPRLYPYEEAPGMVWKVEVNGINAYDDYLLLDPIGVGSHEFKVYFNRAMDTSIDPFISYGVRIPYTQKIITEEGTWSDDGKIYTVTHDIRVGAADGINSIRISKARDLNYFVIPDEDLRFHMLVQSAGSASAGWYATPGLGKIALTWEAPSAEEIDDALGYNMYRYQVDADGVESDPVKLNETLIVEDTDESTTGVYYSDFDVVEGETYFYKYNILRTSFETTDFSSVVSSTPLTSTLGDSNGDFTVDVLDLVHDVDYILGNNPTPFIFLAGDVNADNAINVLDIVGTVDIILNPSDATDTSIGSTDIQYYPSNSIGNATFSWEGNDLFVEADHNIGGLQLAFSNDFEYTVSSELATIEKLDYIQDDNKVVMLFSFNNTVISSGKTKLLTRLDESKELNIDLAVVGTTSGSKLTAIFEDTNLEDIESPLQSDSLEFLSMVPNPTSGMVNLNYYLPEQMDGVVAKVYDMLGRLVHIQAMESREGMSNTSMQLNKLQTGNYIVLISAEKNGGTKHIANKTLIIK